VEGASGGGGWKIEREAFRVCEEACDVVPPLRSDAARSPAGEAAEPWSVDVVVSVACLRPLTADGVLNARLWPRCCGLVLVG
jgi:hypothetical protein